MGSPSTLLARTAFACAFGAACATLFSIAISHLLLALALALLLLSGAKLRFPPIWIPLALFVAGTLVSMFLSVDPASGRPQLRKFYVFLTLLAIASTFRALKQVRWLVLAWVGIALLSALRALFQFAGKWSYARAAGRDFYSYYVGERISGFMSHWMTFSGQEMTVLLVGTALLFWGRPRGWERTLLFIALPVIFLAILLGFTRGIWLATFFAGLYLLWNWRRWAVAAVPALLAVAIFFGPSSIRTRFESLLRPRGELDSNQHRIVTWRTGVEMIKAHPLTGLGPEQVKAQFDKYVPPDIPRPLPEGWYGHLHNIYLHYAAERGIPTMLALMALLAKVLWDWIAALRKLLPGEPGAEQRWVLRGGIAMMIGILVTGLFELNLGDSEVLMQTLTMIAMGYVARDEALANVNAA